MKTRHKILSVLLLLLGMNSCQKEHLHLEQDSKSPSPAATSLPTIAQARQWLESQDDQLIAPKTPIRWDRAKRITTGTTNRIILPLAGQPSIQGHKMGYRQLSIQLDPKTGQLQGRYLEIIPDYLYHQAKRRVQANDFTGQILSYNLSYKLIEGKIYRDGKQIGQILPAPSAPDTTESWQAGEPGQLAQHIGPLDYPIQRSADKTMRMQAITTCTWVKSWYVDAENTLNIVNSMLCQTSYFDLGTPSYLDNGISTDYPSNSGGGSGATTNYPPPAPSNIPGENSPKVDPKKMMDCFGTVRTEGAAFQVKVLVMEPFPGTVFNVGPNSFGHVAIQLTKVNGNQAVTQTVGFYGSGGGLDKLISTSQILNNGGLEYDLHASYFTDAQSFDKILGYISNPPKNYHYTDFNCAAFVYYAAQAGNLPVPNPTTTFGMSGPGGAGYGMSPAGMAIALREAKLSNPNENISQTKGTAPASKGECE